MSIITELREEVFRNNNTAQNLLKSILEEITGTDKPSSQRENESDQDYLMRLNHEYTAKKKYIESHHKHSSFLIFSESFSGDLDFSILAEYGLRNIQHIEFVGGKITSIRGLPDTLLRFHCPNNLLIDLENIPNTIEELDLQHNHIKHLALTKKTNLKKLNISHNIFEEFDHIPLSLVELHCNNNQIKFVFFNKNVNLKVINVSNNPITIIDNLPENLHEFNMDNTPAIEFRNSSTDFHKLRRVVDEENDIRQTIEYKDALQKYFQLKDQYETELRENRRSAFSTTKSKKRGKMRAAAVLPKCFNCKRRVGTVFTHSDHHYKAVCGDNTNPCNLHIDIFNGYYDDLQNKVYEFTDLHNDLKEETIMNKLDEVLSYIDTNTVLSRHKKILNDYTEVDSIMNTLNAKYIETFHNEEKKEQITNQQHHIYMIKEKIKEMLNEYNTTGNQQVLAMAVRIQIDELIPAIEQLRRLVSEHIEVNVSTGILPVYYLFKKEVALSKLSYLMTSPPRVIHFIRSAAKTQEDKQQESEE